jgi:ATP-dependent helicase/nuclease subunit A
MSAPRRDVPAPTRAAQWRASDPGGSAWVSANAGSGKTYVLVRRVLRLLLAGAQPSRILCLTFTKAAAANMSAKVFAELAKWTTLSDAELSAEIEGMGGACPGEARLGLARKLFARTIETPGGLKIQTIHAFCERLLHLFPFEANVAAGFRVLEDREAADLLRKARSAAFERAAREPELAEAIERVARGTGAEGFDGLLSATLRRREELAASGDAEAYSHRLAHRLGLAPGETVASIKIEMFEGGGGPKRWRDWAAKLATGTKTDKERGATLNGAAVLTDAELALETYLTVFFTQAGPPRKVLATKGVAERFPNAVEALYAERDRLERLGERLRSAEAVARSRALVAVADEVLKRYADLKNTRGWLDFDDLIQRARALLENAGAAWVLYKLDSGIDHILVDEAQDTSQAQWDILRTLSSDFLAGEGARGSERTFFAVGDEKQSIFSFQGAAPAMFDTMRREFERRHFHAKRPFSRVDLNLSFRSAPAVLDSVDRVFAVEAAWRGVSAGEDKPPPHEAFHAGLPGLVEIWAPTAPAPVPAPEDWRMPLDAASRDDPAVALAERIAAVIKGWLSPESAERVVDAATRRPRRIGAGDIMILVRSRGPLFEALTRALRRARVPCAGADRLTLRDHIAVMDLIAAGRAALGEDDDLSLAAVLKSPLIGLDDGDLLEIAPRRAGTLAAALAARGEPRFVEAAAKIARWRARARLAPYDFYARLIGGDGGRRALLGRLGPEAADAIDEFLSRALAFERARAPSLTAFLAEAEAADVAIKRDMEAAGDSVRVMTVHAAKGLEAPVVFLPDTCSAPSGRHDPKWLELVPPRPEDPPLYLWATSKDEDSPPIREARLAAQAVAAGEHRRLLYVAMTRAAERLVIAGYEGARPRPEDCWYNLIRLGLDPAARAEPAPWNPQETVWRIGRGAAAGEDLQPGGASAPADLPSWLRTPAPPEFAPAPLAPSRLGAGAAGRAGPERRARLEAGRLAHALLQDLPEVPPEGRRAAAERFLQQNGAMLSPPRRQELATRALAVLALPDLAPLFAAGSRAEVAIAGTWVRPGAPDVAFSGRADRLAVTPDAVYLADFKTGADPNSTSRTDYIRQLAFYAAALKPLYPDRAFHAFLVWIEAGRLTRLSPTALEQAVAGLTGAAL